MLGCKNVGCAIKRQDILIIALRSQTGAERVTADVRALLPLSGGRYTVASNDTFQIMCRYLAWSCTLS